MSGVPLLVITPNETRDLAGPVPLTEYGAVRRVPFDGGQAFFVEEGTTNLVPNPSFEIDLSGWVGTRGGAGPLGVTLARDTTQSTDGTVSLRVDVDGTTYRQGVIMAPNQIEIAPATTYTLSAFVKAPAGVELELGADLWNGVGEYVGGFGTKIFVGTGSWERVVNTQTVRNEPLDMLRPFVRTPVTGYSATTFWVDGVQVEQKPYATSFTHGDMGTGYSWTGTPHESASVREAGYVSVLGLNAIMPEGCIYVRYAPPYYRVGAGNVSYVVHAGASAGDNNWYAIAHSHNGIGTPQMMLYRRAPSAVRSRTVVGSQDALTPRSAAIIWGSDAVEFRSSDGRSDSFPTVDEDNGYHMGSFRLPPDGMMTAAAIFYDRSLTEDEIARLDSIPTSELTWANIATPEVRVKQSGAVVRVAGMWTKRNGLLKETRLG